MVRRKFARWVAFVQAVSPKQELCSSKVAPDDLHKGLLPQTGFLSCSAACLHKTRCMTAGTYWWQEPNGVLGGTVGADTLRRHERIVFSDQLLCCAPFTV
jgi:hypothetical protein